MIRFFREWLCEALSWRLVANTGVWAYFQNDCTGRRRVERVGCGHQPLNTAWLAHVTKAFDERPDLGPPPFGRSGVRPAK
ncbi:MAG TPA: hypothetical protein VFB02_13780 [Bradyrhizobium sp.]|nr:hypothetical protein [Bradyrhizobium sp.]